MTATGHSTVPDSRAPSRTVPHALSPQDALAAQLDDPQVASALTQVLNHADLIAVMLSGLDGFLGRSETIGESLAGSVAELKLLRAAADGPLAGLDRGQLDLAGLDLPGLLGATRTLAGLAPRLTPLLDAVAASGVLEPAVAEQVGRLAKGAATGLEQAGHSPLTVNGPVSLLRNLKDPDVSRGLGFLLTVLKSIGSELDSTPPSSVPTSSSQLMER